MRGSDGMQESLFMMAKLEDFVPGKLRGHGPLGKLRGQAYTL